MSRPRDDELEAMAVVQDSLGHASVASMLRACKGQDTWNAAIEAVGRLRGIDVQKRDAEDVGEAYDLAIDEAQDAIRALAAERDALRDEAEFLLERLHEWSSDNLTDENCGDWFGHVDPSMERLSALTGEAKP